VRVLALDTATRATAVAFADDGAGLLVARRDDPPPGARPRHTTRLLALAVDALAEAGAGWDDVQRLAVGVGPGTFTGLRIGVASARALAASLQIPLVGVSTLRSLATGVSGATGAPGGELVVAVIDARRGEVFAAAWPAGEALDPAADPVFGPAAYAPDELARTAAGSARSWLAVGDGAVAFRAALERSGARIPEEDSELHRVSAVHHCRLAAALEPGDPTLVRPEYLRVPDAEAQLRTGVPS
jgi:tRNA threonylcarbamoyladenosine biosynthesis protein TsaB